MTIEETAPIERQDPWRVWVLSLFPQMFPGTLGYSLAGKALEKDIWSLSTLDIREYALDKHRTVDDAPIGGGTGMVIRPDVLDGALQAVGEDVRDKLGMELFSAEKMPKNDLNAAEGLDAGLPIVYLSPRGQRLDQAMARKLASKKGLVLICGRFEGVDQRVLDRRNIVEVSIGDYVLSGGDLAAMVLMDAVVRLLPGVIGDPSALDEESFARGLLEYPQYTRPQDWDGDLVPEVLLSGHHARIREWRQAQSEALTQARRPDLWADYVKTKDRGSDGT